MPQIHPTALVAPQAELADDVMVEAYAVVGPQVRLGEGTRIRHHATVEGRTSLGRENVVWPYAYLGGRTQDLKYRGGEPGLEIGDGNHFREFCTVHCATFPEGVTRIGHRNHFLAYTHIAHDCRLGSGIVMSNNATLAGHVVLEDQVVMGGFAAAHQFCRVGRLAMVGGMSKIVQDVPPFCIADGNPAEARAVNKVGLERAGWSAHEQGLARKIFKTVYGLGLNRSQALAELQRCPEAGEPVVAHFLAFAAASERGLLAGLRSA